MVRVPKREPYTLIYAPQVTRHLRSIDRKFHSLIRRAIERRLRFQASRETRNKKPLRRPSALEATWELRCGPNNRFRVFYDILPEAREIHVLAAGVKEGSRLLIVGEEIEL